MKRKKKFAPVISKVKVKSSNICSLKNKDSKLFKKNNSSEILKGGDGNNASSLRIQKEILINTNGSESDTQLQRDISEISNTSFDEINNDTNEVNSSNVIITSKNSTLELQNTETLSSTLLKNFSIENLPDETANLGHTEPNGRFILNDNEIVEAQNKDCEANSSKGFNSSYDKSIQHQSNYQGNEYYGINSFKVLNKHLPNSFNTDSFSVHSGSSISYPSFLSSNPFPASNIYSQAHNVNTFLNHSLPYYQPTFTDLLNSNSVLPPLDMVNPGLYVFDNQFPYYTNQSSFINYNYPHLNHSQPLNLSASPKEPKINKKIDVNKKEAEYHFFSILEQMKRNKSNKWPDINKDKMTMLNYLYINPPEENGKELGLKKKENEYKSKNVKNSESLTKNKITKPIPSTAPRLELDSSGNIIIIEEHIESSEAEVELTHQSESPPVNQNSFRISPVSKRCKWSKVQTAKFYEALLCCGSNFSMMSDIMKTHTDKEIKRKYKNECKKNPKVIDEILKRHLNNEGDLKSFVSELETSKQNICSKNLCNDLDITNVSL